MALVKKTIDIRRGGNFVAFPTGILTFEHSGERIAFAVRPELVPGDGRYLVRFFEGDQFIHSLRRLADPVEPWHLISYFRNGRDGPHVAFARKLARRNQ